jgi:hypothetical protein
MVVNSGGRRTRKRGARGLVCLGIARGGSGGMTLNINDLVRNTKGTARVCSGQSGGARPLVMQRGFGAISRLLCAS